MGVSPILNPLQLGNGKSHYKSVTIINKDHIIKNIEKKDHQEWLKNKRSTYNTLFDDSSHDPFNIYARYKYEQNKNNL